MGVHGLWKLLDPVGKPIPVETLENHVLAVDVSIWLHQLMKGFQDSTGSPIPNAHLVGLFHRICKLLFFRIKPVFVFDGGVPTLKKKTIANRHLQKDRATIAAEKARQQLLKNLLKQRAVGQVLEELQIRPGTSTASQRQPDLYELPPIAEDVDNSDDASVISASSSSDEDYKKKTRYKDLHTIDVKSKEFKALPADIRHDILTDLKETRKQNSWGRIHEMPEEIGGFSNYQMNRLLKRRSVQVSLEEAEKEMGGHTLSLGDVENLLVEQGVDTSDVGRRIASDNVTRYVFVNEALNDGKDKEEDNSDVTEPPQKLKDPENDTVKKEDIIKQTGIKTENIDVKTEKEIILSPTGSIEEYLYSPNFEVKVESSSSSESIFEDIEHEEFEMNRKMMIENRGLTQEQILTLIKQQNVSCKSSLEVSEDKSKTRGVNEEQKSFSLEQPCIGIPDIGVENHEDKGEESNVLNKSTEQTVIKKGDSCLSSTHSAGSDKICSNKVLTKTSNMDVKGKLTEENVEKSTIVSIFDEDSGTVLMNEGDIKNVQITTGGNDVHKQNEQSKLASDSSSDDDLVDVEEKNQNKILKTNVTTDNAQPTKNSLFEVTINTKENVNSKEEDDIFADIFTNNEPDNLLKISNSTRLEQKNGSPEINEAAENIEFISTDSSSSDCENNHSKAYSMNDQGERSCDSSETVDKTETCQYFEALNAQKKDDIVEPVDENQKSTDANEDFNKVQDEMINQLVPEDPKPKRKLSTKELLGLQSILEKQESELIQVQGREERLASSVTEQMRLEAEELLQLFGVPWITAPMEAEAQCAFLDLIGLTQGTITDDSDIWLFGAHKVYKNFFNQKKYVMQFQADDIKHFFKLSRGDLIELAMLVGSDYTVGINGVGPVTALEIIATFRPGSSSDEGVMNTLKAFKEWLQHPSNVNATPLARKLKDVQLEEGFPSKDVVEAYLHPNVDQSDERFSWSTPDLEGLRNYASRKFGWNQSKVDEVLLPVIKSLTQKTSQTRIDSFFNLKPALSAHNDRLSQRVQKAVSRLGGEIGIGRGSRSSGESGRGRVSRSGGESGRGRGGIIVDADPLEDDRPRAPRPKRGRGGIRDEIRTATARDRNRSRQPRTRALANVPIVPIAPSTSARDEASSKAQTEELIPQRERDRLEALKRKIQAVELLKSKKPKGSKRKISRAPIKKQANLSESSSDEN